MKALLQRIRQILRDRRTRRFFKRFVGTFAAIVVFVTTYALVLPAITMEAEAQCGIEAHQHDDSCYEEVLVCDISESEGHHHDESCYSVSLQLICRTDEHQHDSDCYDENGELTCEKAEHIHSEENGCYKEVRELVCGQEESTGHQHNEGCYEKVLACGKEAHTHSQACYHSDASGNTAESAAVSSTESAAVVVSSTSASSTTSASSGASTTTTAPAAVAASSSASTDETASSASAASTVSENSPEDAYVPVLDPVDFNRILTGDTGIYYYHPKDNENIPENSGDITDWMPLNKETILDPADIIRVYLAYSIPAGSLNSTNPVARYRLPSNLHLSDSQVESINSTVNGIANQYADMDNLEITDPAKYSQSLGVEAIEGTRKPSDDIAKYFDKHKKMDGQEFISATVKVEEIYDTDDTDAANAGFDTNDPGGSDGEDAAPDAESSNSEYIRNNTVNNENSTYSGTDLVFTFTPYSIQKNQHTYDSTGKPVSAGQEIRGWMTFDLRTDQIDFEAASTDTGKEAAIVFVPETRDPQSGLDIDEISQILHLQETVAETGIASDDKAEKPALLYPARTFQDSVTASMGTLSTDTETGLSTALPEETEMTVYVEADEGTFPEGTTMKVSTVEDMDSVASAVEEAVTADDAVSNKTRGFHAVDISFRNAEGIEIEPLKLIRVSIKSESIKQAVEDSSTAPVVVHVTDPALEQAHAADQDSTLDQVYATDQDSTLDQVPASDQAPADWADEDIGTTDEDGSYNSGKVNDTSKPATAEDSETEKETGGNRDNESPIAAIVETGKQVSAENNGTIDTDTLTFETGSFSVYAIVYTVDFHYEVNGKTYEFSLPGGGFVSFTDLVEVLGIMKDTNADGSEAEEAVEEEKEQKEEKEENEEKDAADTLLSLDDVIVSDAVKELVADVEKVEFSSPSLLSVSKVEENTTVGAIKDSLGLECQYSGELTKDQIDQIDAQTVEAGDWALISIQPFLSEESLTVTMKDGEVFTIHATDAQIKKTVIDAKGDTWEITVTYGEDAQIPDGAKLEVEEVLPEDKMFAEFYRKAVAAANGTEYEEADSSADITEENYARFFDITIVNGEKKIEPEAPVKVEIRLADTPETADEWKVIHFEETDSVVMGIKTVAADKAGTVEMAFETSGFSVYGVITVPGAQPDPDVTDLDGRSFTISHDSRYATTTITPIQNNNSTNGLGKTSSASQAATWYFERPASSGSGNTYYIYTLNDDGEKQYINLTRNNSETNRANVSLSDNPQAFTVTRDGNTYRLSAHSYGTTYYLDEHNGNSGNAFAGWNGATDNGKLTLNFPSQPVMQDNGQYMALVKYNGKYYIVNNDCSLTEVNYDEATKKVEVDDPMLWTINKNNPNGHIYFNSTEAGFNSLQTASDWYRRYLDPSTNSGYLEETNKPGAGHVEIDAGQQWTHNGITYWEHQITDRSNVENKTTVSIDNTSTGDSSLYNIYHGNKNGSNYLGVVTDNDGNLRLSGKQPGSNAAEFVFASPTEVKGVDWTNHTVNHIDISIAGTAKVSVPLAYGKYYGSTAGDAEDPILTVTDNMKIELSEAQMVDPGQLRITAEDMKRATITATRADNGKPIDDAFYITGYSGNVANGTSNDQVRIEGSFLVADLRDTEYEYVDYNAYNFNWYGYKDRVKEARKNNTVEYTVTVVKPLTYKLIDPQKGQLYDADGEPLTITVDVAFSASFNYWDSENECPAVNWATGFGGDEWLNGGIDPSNISGMDFVLGGDADNPSSPLVALEITKVIMDQDGNRIELKTPVTNYFDIYENKNATNTQKNAVQGLHVIDSLNHPEWEPDSRDATIHNNYTFWRTKKLKVDDTGSAIVFDFNATDAMYYIVERHDKESLPETVTDKDDKKWTYINTFIETEYVRRDDDNGTHDEYSNRTLHPQAMHTTEVFTRDDGSYASIPEVAGHFTKLDGTPKKEGFLEFYVYNIYKQIETVDVPIDKTWYDEEGNLINDEDSGSPYTWTATFELEEREVHVSGPVSDKANTTSWLPISGIARKTITNEDSGNANESARTFKDLPKYRYYYDAQGNESVYRIMYSVSETEYTLSKDGDIISRWDNVNGLDPISSVYYAPLFPHDAGDANDSSGIGESHQNFYHIIVENHVSEEIVTDELDLLISKAWENGTDLDENSFARFQLKRYKKTEYYDQAIDDHNMPVFDGEGNPVWNQSPGIEGPKEDLVFTNEKHYYILKESNEWSLPIDRLPKTTVFEKNGHKTVNHYSYYFEEIQSDPSGFYAVFRASDGSTLSGDESHQIDETGTEVKAENHRAPVTELYKVDVSKIAGIQSSEISNSDLLEGAAFTIQKYKSFSPDNKDTSWGPNQNGTVSAVVDPDNGGIFTVTGLSPGLYEIDEMTYPAGYVQGAENPRFRIDYNSAKDDLEIVLLNSDGSVKVFNGEDNDAPNVLVVSNTPGAALPNTGGPGTRLFTILGSILIAGAGLLLWRRWKFV